jgi:hypothetical protein
VATRLNPYCNLTFGNMDQCNQKTPGGFSMSSGKPEFSKIILQMELSELLLENYFRKTSASLKNANSPTSSKARASASVQTYSVQAYLMRAKITTSVNSVSDSIKARPSTSSS